MDTIAAGTLQAELDQPMAPFFIDAPGGQVEVECRGSSYCVEMRGYRKNSEGSRSWVGASVSVYLPEYKGWYGEMNIKEASINHSSSSSQGVEGDVVVTIQLLQLAVELADRLNEEADVALAPIKRYFEQQRTEHEAKREAAEKFRATQREELARFTGTTIRVFVKGRKNPVKVTYDAGNHVTRTDNGEEISIKRITKLEWKNPSGTFEPVAFPVES